MCEVGVWRTFDDLEENLTLDDLFLLYETASERQQRLLKTIGSAFGADYSEKKEPETIEAPIVGEGGELLFGYEKGT